MILVDRSAFDGMYSTIEGEAVDFCQMRHPYRLERLPSTNVRLVCLLARSAPLQPRCLPSSVLSKRRHNKRKTPIIRHPEKKKSRSSDRTMGLDNRHPSISAIIGASSIVPLGSS